MIKALLLAPIRLYKFFLSPWVGQSCRFTPTCSSYAIEAIETQGAIRGTYLATKRLCRCHPWAAGGHDPVCPDSTTPPASTNTSNAVEPPRPL